MDAKSEFLRKFLDRTALAREARGYSQGQMADLLGLGPDGQGTYKQYETRSPLPHHLIPRFCLIAGVGEDWLFTGTGRAPQMIVDAPSRPFKKPRRSRKKIAA